MKNGEMPDHDPEYDLRTMIEAAKIKMDPKRMKAMMGKRDEMMAAMKGMGGKMKGKM